MNLEDFIVNVGPGGTFRPSGDYHTTSEQIDAMFQKFEAENKKNITVFFHGGLVPEKNGLETAIKMAAHFEAKGQSPICFVWETGLLETLKSNVSKIADTKIFQKLSIVLIKKLSGKLGFDFANGRGAGQMLSEEEIESELSKVAPFENFDQNLLEKNGRGPLAVETLPVNEEDLEAELNIEFQYLIEGDLEFVDEINKSKFNGLDNSQTHLGGRGVISTSLFIKNVAQIAIKVIKRFVKKRDHNFYPTIIEEILRKFYIAEVGAWMWSEMKAKSNDMWGDNATRSNQNKFAGTYVLDKLVTYKNQYPDVKINLVGHSAGSIAICNLLNSTALRYPDYSYNKIVFMAPACHIDLFNRSIVQFPERFNHFRMYTMADDYEKKDRMIRYVYTHSLLYLISGILEKEGKDYDSYILGMERFLLSNKPFENITQLNEVIAFLSTRQNSIVYSRSTVDAVDGLKTESLSHGGFDDDPATISSLTYYLNEA